MDDECNCLERAESMSRRLHGKPVSVEDMADNFALYGLKRRAAALENLDADLHGEIGSGAHALRRHARLIGLRQKMASLHEALRMAKR